MKFIITTIQNNKIWFFGFLGLLAILLLWCITYAVVFGLMYNDWRLLDQISIGNIFAPYAQAYIYLHNTAVQNAIAISTIVPLSIIIAICFILKIIGADKSEEAHFQSFYQIAKNGFFRKKGPIIGSYNKRLLRATDPTHHLIIGPTRSGKGAGYAIPNALFYEGSMIITDLKGEIFEHTAGYRKCKGNDIYIFAPGETDTNFYNPLDFIRNDEIGNRITDIQNLAHILIPLLHNSENSVWQAQAQSILAGLISYILESKHYTNKKNLTEVLAILDSGIDLQNYLARIMATEGEMLSRFTRSGLNAYISLNGKAAQSTLMDVRNALMAFRNPLISAATQKTDIPIADLNKRPITIYLAPNITNISLCKPLLTMFIEQVLNKLTLRLDVNSISVFFLLDEFRQLQRVNEVVTKLPYVAGYNITISFIIQELRMLDGLYGMAVRDSIVGNCGIQIVMGANDDSTASYVSKSLGKRNVGYTTKTKSQYGLNQGNTTKVEQIRERDLMQPQEIRQLNKNHEIIIVEGKSPILAEKIKYYKNRRFRAAVDFAKKNKPNIPNLHSELYHNLTSTVQIVTHSDIAPPPVPEALIADNVKAMVNLKEAHKDFTALAQRQLQKSPKRRQEILDLFEETIPDALPE